jgi:hypothetical protein
MAPRAIDAKAAERCASIVGAKQKGNEPPASHAPVTDVALSPSPQKATLGIGTCRRVADVAGRHGADAKGHGGRRSLLLTPEYGLLLVDQNRVAAA